MINIKVAKTRNLLLLFILISLISSGCRKLVETAPPTDQLTGESTFLNNQTAIGAVTDLYRLMGYQGVFQGRGISAFTGLSGDELTLNSAITTGNSWASYFNNTLYAGPGSSAQSGHELWAQLYNFIFRANAAIEGLSKSNYLTPGVKQQLLGECMLLRAFYYFYLVNLFGDVPIALTTDPEVNTLLPRSHKALVYDQIKADLKNAEELLRNIYLDATLLNTTTYNERVRPTKWAASALLARIYLFTNDFVKAEEQASLVINNTTLFGPLPSLNSAFLKNSREAIWQLQPTLPDINTFDATTWIIPPQGPNTNNNPVFLSKRFLNSFETNDQRRILGNWVDTTIYTLQQSPLIRDTVAYVNKYKINASLGVNQAGLSEYFMVLRLGEQYLIRAEARTKLGNIGGAQTDLNVIRARAGLPNTIATDETSLLNAILNERRHELFCELGQRWFDLKRTGKIDQVMTIETPLKSNGVVQWEPYQTLYPLPFTELQRAPNLVQNPGYQ